MTMQDSHLVTTRSLSVLPFILGLAAWLLSVFSALSHGAETESNKGSGQPDRLVMGISPWTHQALLFRWAKPIIAHVQQQTDKKVTIGSASDFPTYFKRAKAGSFDAFIAPLNYGLHLVKEEAFTPLLWVRVGYHSLIVCDKNTGHKTLADLKNTTVVFPPEFASTTMVIKQALSEANVEVSSVYVKNQWEVIENLVGGKAPCATILSSLFQSKSGKLRDRFFELYRYPLQMDALMMAPPSAPQADLDAVLSLAEGYHAPGSIVKRFDPLKPSKAELYDLYEKLAPVLARFKAMVSDTGGGPK